MGQCDGLNSPDVGFDVTIKFRVQHYLLYPVSFAQSPLPSLLCPACFTSPKDKRVDGRD